MEKLKDKVILITGAAKGLGLPSALEAAKNGALLSLVDFNAETLEKAKEEIEYKYPDTQILTAVADGLYFYGLLSYPEKYLYL